MHDLTIMPPHGVRRLDAELGVERGKREDTHVKILGSSEALPLGLEQSWVVFKPMVSPSSPRTGWPVSASLRFG